MVQPNKHKNKYKQDIMWVYTQSHKTFVEYVVIDASLSKQVEIS
jgi:hypothetical protein